MRRTLFLLTALLLFFSISFRADSPITFGQRYLAQENGRETHQKIGILFGTFDPPHVGHRNLAQTMKEKFNLDVVYFIPRDKEDYKPGKQPIGVRNKLVEILVADSPGLKLVPADVAAAMKGLRSQEAFMTLREFFPENQISLILGDDTLQSLSHNQVQIPENFQILVSRRSGNEHLQLPSEIDGVKVQTVEAGGDTSSTVVRKILSEGGVPPMLPPNVYGYIQKHGLYGTKVLPPQAIPTNCHEMVRAISF